MEKNNYYGKGLSLVHDQYFGYLAENAGHYILELIKKNHHNSVLNIIDLGCGSGITAKMLSDAGHKVTGLDYSPEMLAIARQKAPSANFIEGSIFDYKIPNADIIISIGEPFNYLFDNKSTSTNLHKLFHDIYNSLNNNGYLIFDLVTIGTLVNENPLKRIIENDKWSMFLEMTEEPQKHILTREITLFIQENGLYTREKEIHKQQLYDLAEITTQLEDIGFIVEPSKYYNEIKLRDGHIAFTCKKQI